MNSTKELMNIIKKYIKENHLENDLFMKLLLDDLYVCYNNIGSEYENMCILGRQRSQGNQEAYTPTYIPKNNNNTQQTPYLKKTPFLKKVKLQRNNSEFDTIHTIIKPFPCYPKNKDNSIENYEYILGKYNGNDVILKKGKFGLYISWGENSKNLKEFGNRPIENITFDEVKKYLDEGSNLIREVSSSISIRKGAKGDYIFYKSAKMKKPQFFDLKNFYADVKEDYKICDITILKSWINDKYKI